MNRQLKLRFIARLIRKPAQRPDFSQSWIDVWTLAGLALPLLLLVVGGIQAQSVEWRSLLDAATAMYQKGEYAGGMPLAIKAMGAADQTDDAAVSLSLNVVGMFCAAQARYAEAEPLFKRSIELQEKTLGRDHPDTAIVINNLAALYMKQGRYTEAEPLFRRSLAIREKALEEDHPDIATASQ